MGLVQDWIERATEFKLVQKAEYNTLSEKLYDAAKANMRPVATNTAGIRYYFPKPVEVLWMTRLAYSSDILRNVIDKIGYKIFRNGVEWKPKFESKCTSCDIEYQYDITQCPKCSGSLIKPDEKQKGHVQELIDCANENGQTLIEVLEQVNDDVEILDNQWIVLIRDYAIDSETGKIIYDRVREIVRGDPANFKFVADARGRLGRDDAGKPVRICVQHRDKPINTIQQVYCKTCKGKSLLQPAHFVETSEAGTQYYTKNEVIHNSKYNPGLLYGFPPVYSVMGKVELLLNLDEYLRESYGSKKSPKSIAVVRTKNHDSFRKAWEYISRMAKLDPNGLYPLTVENQDGNGKSVEIIDLMKPLTEMQAVEFMNDNRLQIASFYGVSPIFVNNTQASGGLNNEGLQFGVTNEAAERGQSLYNEKFFKRLLNYCGVTDWVLQLKAAEEQDVMSDIQRDGAKIDNAMKMKQLGFTVSRKADAGLEFQYSQDPVALTSGAPETTETNQIPGLSDSVPTEISAPTQSFHGIPEEASSKAKAETPPKKLIEDKAADLQDSLDEPLDAFVKKIDWKRKPNEKVIKATIDRLTKKLGYDLHRKSKAQIKKLYLDAMEQVEKEMNMNILFGKRDENAIDVIAGQKVFTQAYAGMSTALSSKMNDIIAKAYENPQEFTVEKMVERMKMAADEEEYRLHNIARTETQHVSSVARLNSYMQTDDFDQAKFEWFGPEDQRTTPVCQAIKARVGNGVTAQQLKAIVEDEARKGNAPGWEARDWTPHVNCRHMPLRIDVLGKAKAEAFYPKKKAYGYNHKLALNGDSALSVGWRNTEGQQARFQKLALFLDKGSSVLDVGAGLGHFQEYAKANGLQVEYAGIDVLDEFVQKAKAMGRNVENGDIMSYSKAHDYVIASGTFNTEDSPSLHDAIPQMDRLSKAGFGFNFLEQNEGKDNGLKTHNLDAVLDQLKARGHKNITVAKAYLPGERTVFVLKAKARVYLTPGQSAPEGVNVQEGDRGGKYYDSESSDKPAEVDKGKKPDETTDQVKPGNSEGPSKAPAKYGKEVPKINAEERINEIQSHFKSPETKKWATGILAWHNKTPANVPLFVFGTHTNENPKTAAMRKTLLDRGYSVVQIPQEFSRYQGVNNDESKQNRENLNSFLGGLLKERLVVDIHAGEGGPQELDFFDAESLKKMDGLKAPENYIGMEVMGNDSGQRALEDVAFAINQFQKKQQSVEAGR